MVKIIYMARETFSSIKALEYLCEKKKEIEIIGAIIRNDAVKLQKLCNENRIEILSEEQLRERYVEGKQEADYIFSFYWKKIKADILCIPKRGSINFHPGPLPEARGSGYHVAILEKWGYWGVTAHYMDEEFDTGGIIECRHFNIDDNIVNWDLVQMTHEQLFQLFIDIVEKILKDKRMNGIKQENGRYFSLKELEEGKLILGNESTDEIDRKICAYWNPPYTGAQIELNGKRYTIINENILEWIYKKLSG